MREIRLSGSTRGEWVTPRCRPLSYSTGDHAVWRRFQAESHSGSIRLGNRRAGWLPRAARRAADGVALVLLLRSALVFGDVEREVVHHLGLVAGHLVVGGFEELVLAIAQLIADGLLDAGVFQVTLSGGLS